MEVLPAPFLHRESAFLGGLSHEFSPLSPPGTNQAAAAATAAAAAAAIAAAGGQGGEPSPMAFVPH